MHTLSTSRNEWLNSVVALWWLEGNPCTHCTCNPSTKYFMFYNVVWTAAPSTPFQDNTQTHTYTFFDRLCHGPSPPVLSSTNIRPFPLMKLSVELTARHAAVLACSTLLCSVVRFLNFFFFSERPFYLSSFLSTPLRYTILYFFYLSFCSPMWFERQSTTYNKAEIWSTQINWICSTKQPIACGFYKIASSYK